MRRPGLLPIAVVCVLAFVAGSLGVGWYLLGRPKAYSAQSALFAVPARQPAQINFGAVVSLTMPGLADVATSADVHREALAALPSGSRFDGTIAVHAVPGSGVALITTTDSSADLASQMAQAVGQAVINQDLLAPAGTFQFVDPSAPTPQQIAPDRRTAYVVSLSAGLLAAAGAALLLRALRPRLLSRRQVTEAVADPAVPVLTADDEVLRRLPELCQRFRGSAGLDILPAGSASIAAAELVGRTLGNDAAAARSPADKPPAGRPILVAVRMGRASPQDLRTAVALVRGGRWPLVGVVMALRDGGARR
jgi:hypothetical protein